MSHAGVRYMMSYLATKYIGHTVDQVRYVVKTCQFCAVAIHQSTPEAVVNYAQAAHQERSQSPSFAGMSVYRYPAMPDNASQSEMMRREFEAMLVRPVAPVVSQPPGLS